MKLTDLEKLPPEDLHALAIRLGLEDKTSLPPTRLAREILIRSGELADGHHLSTAYMYGRIRRLEERLDALEVRVGAHLQRIEATAERGKAIAEALLLGAGTTRAPLPSEVARLGETALRHLAASLAVDDVETMPKAALLNQIAEKLRWEPWKTEETDEQEEA